MKYTNEPSATDESPNNRDGTFIITDDNIYNKDKNFILSIL